MGVRVSSSHIVSAVPSSSGGGLLTLFPCSSVKSWKSVLHNLLQSESFPQAAALHELPQHEVLPTRCSPSGTGCSSVGPHWVTSPASKPAPAWAPLSTGPQVHSSCQEPAPARGSPQGHSLLQASTCSGSLFHRLQVAICSTVDLHVLQADSLPHHHMLQGKTLCSGISRTSSPSLFTDLGNCRDVSFT